MADISSLSGLLETEPLDLPSYKANQEFQLPKKGKYTVKAPDSFPPTAFGASRSGYLSASVDPTIVGPTNEGYTIRFTKVSAKTWKDQRSGQVLSQIGKYLRACGQTTPVGTTPQELADRVESTAGAHYVIKGDWKAYNKNTGFEVVGMENFPTNGNGEHLPYIDDPTDRDESGTPVRLRANFFVTHFLSV